jgi:Holliday junction resolvase RusA-like endonuclease
MWSWCIPGEPIGKARALVFRNPHTGRVHGVTPERTRDWESKAVEVFACHWDGSPLDAPVTLDIVAVFSRPKRLMRNSSPGGRIPHDVKPDWDNIAKAVSDALESGGVVCNDSRVCGARVRKFFAAKGEGPMVSVTMNRAGVAQAEHAAVRGAVGSSPDASNTINFDEIPF